MVPASIESIVVKAFNLMGGEIQWPAIEMVAEIVGFGDDIELFIALLAALRESQKED